LATTELQLSCHGLRAQFSALRKFLGEQPKLFTTPRATAPDKTNFARRLIAKERAGDETGPEQKAGHVMPSPLSTICTRVGRLVASKPSVRRRSAR